MIRQTLMSAAILVTSLALLPVLAGERTEHFDADPNWEGKNNRSTVFDPRPIEQNFGYSQTHHAGGNAAGEIGGTITPAGEPAYYATPIEPKSFNDALTASGKLACTGRQFHALIGFFNAGTVNEWRTSNSIAIRLYGRGDVFYAYLEYCTSRWRAGGDSPQPFGALDQNGRINPHEFPSGKDALHTWSLQYDPKANNGNGAVTATIDGQTAVCHLDSGHKADGAALNRFGMLNIVKSADDGGEFWLDDVTINNRTEQFDSDPKWDARGNRRKYLSPVVRPRFDFGFSNTNHAGGKRVGELGGLTFRGDNKEAGKLGYYGDRLKPLSLAKPMTARGKVSLSRGVSDSSTLMGFFNSQASAVASSDQSSILPKQFLGVVIEGPSRDGFYFYPGCRIDGEPYRLSDKPEPPHILPDGKPHDFTLNYAPTSEASKGRITVTLDGKAVHLDLDEQPNSAARFDRFGIITTWIDGNGQNVYFDDLTYTVEQ